MAEFVIKKRSRPQPRLRSISLDREDEKKEGTPMEDESGEETGLPIADLIELRKLRKARGGIDVAKLNQGDAKRRKKRTREEEGEEEEVKSGLRKGAEGDDEEANKEARARKVVRANNFTQQTDVMDVDKHMMAYIEENLKVRNMPKEAEGDEDEGPADPQEALYRIVDKFKVNKEIKANRDEGSVTNSMTMLTAIPEVDLGMDNRLKNIEETEKAKRHVDENRQQKKKANADEAHLVAQRFYRPNYRAKSDAEIMRDAKLEAMGLRPQGNSPRRSNQMATDEIVMERFKKHLYESPNSRSIHIAPWRITASTNPISSAPDCDALHATLGIPVPEMTFGGNYLQLEHQPTGWRYTFTTEGALKAVKVGELTDGDGSVKVGYADKWLRSRTDPSSEYPMPQTVPTKSYDWTYTTTYSGHQLTDPPSPSTSVLSTDEDYEPPPPPSIPDVVHWNPVDPEDPAQEIPMAELTRPDPILFYAEVPLFDDELHDNGSSALLVRIRVMPTCFFILSRFTLRVDNVLFRTYDTRIYHSFSSDPHSMIRETSGWEAPYDRVRRLLPRRNDLTPLTDPTWIAKILSDFPSSVSQEEGAKTGWRGLGIRREIAVLKSST